MGERSLWADLLQRQCNFWLDHWHSVGGQSHYARAYWERPSCCEGTSKLRGDHDGDRGQPSQNVIFFAEEAAEGSSQLSDVRNDLATIIAQLRIMRNQGPRSVNGGGTPLVATQAGLGVCQGVQ